MGEVWEESERIKLYIQEALLADKKKTTALLKAMRALDLLTSELKKGKDDSESSPS